MNDGWLTAACAVPDAAAAQTARERQARLTKPPGSLGVLEDLAVQLAGLQKTATPRAERVWISVFAGDHGVAAEGVSAFPQAVTGEMVRNFAHGGAAISVLARVLGATLEVINLGTTNDPGDVPGVRREIIAARTANFCEAPAMTTAQVHAALKSGAASAERAAADHAELFIGGDMGIANTTAATALACALLSEEPVVLAGAGTGLDAAGIAHKSRVIERALARHKTAKTPLERLRCLGGFEIAALAGAYIRAAQVGVPAVVDGFITTVSALAAVTINPGVREGLLFSHRSQERGHQRLLRALGTQPLVDLGMRLGEASGAAIVVPLLRMACALHNGMATFAEAGVSEASVTRVSPT